MEKIKVLHIAFNDMGHGGIQACIMTVAEQLKDRINQDVMVFSSKPAYYDEAFLKYGRIIRCPHYEGKNPLRAKLDYYVRYFRIKRNVWRVLKEMGPYDVVHSNSFFEAAPCMAAAKKAGIPVRIAHSHNTAMADRRPFPLRQINELYRKIYRRIILKNATELVGCSQAAADYLFGPGKGYPIHNCVDFSAFAPEQFPQKDWEELRLIHVGNFLPQKNQLFLLDVFDKLQKKLPQSKLIMIGRSSEYLTKVQEKIRRLDLEEKVEILPHDTHIPRAMSQADYFVFPSNFEGLPLSVLEAQAAGMQCFVSTEVTKETDCGLADYIPLELGAEGWAERITEFYLANGTEKKKVDMSPFSKDAFAEKFWNLYRKSENL